MFLKKSILQLFFLVFASLFLACSEDDEKPAPDISSFEPASGTAGTQVTVTGTNFGNAPTVTLNSTPAVVQSSSETSLVFVVPSSPGGPASGKITIMRSDGKTAVSKSDFRTMVPPAIQSFSPEKAAVGKVVTINGSYLSNATVKIGGRNAVINFGSPTQIMVSVPAGAVTGKITVETPEGVAESATPFTLDAHLVTGVLSGFNLEPISVLGPNQNFYVDGKNFSPKVEENIVEINGVAVPVIAVFNETRLTLKVPSTGISSGTLSVTIGGLKVEYPTTMTVPPGRWEKLEDFTGPARQGAAGFVAGGKGYAGFGFNASDLWEFDPATKKWTQKASMPVKRESRTIAFSINGKGYVATSNSSQDDFWEYDPATDSWTQKANLPVIYVKFGVSINGRGYICGLNETMWEYNPSTNQWVQKSNFPGAGRMYGAAVVVNNKLYFGTGTPDFKSYFKDFWQYDPATDQWSQKADFPAAGRAFCVAFDVKGKIYVGAGESGSTVNDWREELYAFDPQTNTWTLSVPVLSSVKTDNVSFSIGDKGYIGLGGSFSSRQFWEFQPD